jgi:hypothetical protein
MLKQGTVDEMKSLISNKGGLARTNLYFVQFPNLVKGVDPYDVGLLCSQVSVPNYNLLTVQRDIGVSRNNVVYGYGNPNVSMTFRVLNDHGVREYFKKWQDKALVKTDDIEGRYENNYPDEYVRPVIITQLKPGVSYPALDLKLGPFDLDLDIGTKFETTYRWKLNRAYPVGVTNETLSDASTNEVSAITVDLAYENFTTETPTSGTDGILKRLGAGVLGSIAARL